MSCWLSQKGSCVLGRWSTSFAPADATFVMASTPRTTDCLCVGICGQSYQFSRVLLRAYQVVVLAGGWSSAQWVALNMWQGEHARKDEHADFAGVI
jgi:hypothetical protein